MRQARPAEIAGLLGDRPDAAQVLDVREPWEFAICSLPGSVHIPMGQITRRFEELARDRPVVCVCHHGMRSLQVAMWLERQGYETVNLAGGIDAWAREVDPACPTY